LFVRFKAECFSISKAASLGITFISLSFTPAI
jgi:hypothetical protein